MIVVLRAVGWLLFGVGALLFIATGAYDGIRSKSIVTMVGAVLMSVGILCTMGATIAAWRKMRAKPPRPSA